MQLLDSDCPLPGPRMTDVTRRVFCAISAGPAGHETKPANVGNSPMIFPLRNLYVTAKAYLFCVYIISLNEAVYCLSKSAVCSTWYNARTITNY